MDTNAVIASFGGTVKTAELCGITPSAVSQWKKSGIPRPWEAFLRQVKPEAFLVVERDSTAASSVQVE